VDYFRTFGGINLVDIAGKFQRFLLAVACLARIDYGGSL
jgi:hypothetical protein